MCKEEIVSYLPLSHVAAQMNDIWISMRFAATTSFAQPDALKVIGLINLVIPRHQKSLKIASNYQHLVTLPIGLVGGDSTGSASNKFSGGPPCVGEDAREDERSRCEVYRFPKECG